MLGMLVYFRRHLLWAYTIALVLVLALPLAQPAHNPLFSYAAHFMLFFGLHTTVEFAHLFAGGRHILKYTIIMAVLLEAMQAFIPYRQFDIIDMSANIFGVFCADAAVSLLKRNSGIAKALKAFNRQYSRTLD